MRNNAEKKGRDPRVEDQTCPECGNKKLWGSRSSTGRGFYIYKCTKCGHMVK